MVGAGGPLLLISFDCEFDVDGLGLVKLALAFLTADCDKDVEDRFKDCTADTEGESVGLTLEGEAGFMRLRLF